MMICPYSSITSLTLACQPMGGNAGDGIIGMAAKKVTAVLRAFGESNPKRRTSASRASVAADAMNQQANSPAPESHSLQETSLGRI
jgi:hypothetical protein